MILDNRSPRFHASLTLQYDGENRKVKFFVFDANDDGEVSTSNLLGRTVLKMDRFDGSGDLCLPLFDAKQTPVNDGDAKLLLRYKKRYNPITSSTLSTSTSESSTPALPAKAGDVTLDESPAVAAAAAAETAAAAAAAAVIETTVAVAEVDAATSVVASTTTPKENEEQGSAVVGADKVNADFTAIVGTDEVDADVPTDDVAALVTSRGHANDAPTDTAAAPNYSNDDVHGDGNDAPGTSNDEDANDEPTDAAAALDTGNDGVHGNANDAPGTSNDEDANDSVGVAIPSDAVVAPGISSGDGNVNDASGTNNDDDANDALFISNDGDANDGVGVATAAAVLPDPAAADVVTEAVTTTDGDANADADAVVDAVADAEADAVAEADTDSSSGDGVAATAAAAANVIAQGDESAAAVDDDADDAAAAAAVLPEPSTDAIAAALYADATVDAPQHHRVSSTASSASDAALVDEEPIALPRRFSLGIGTADAIAAEVAKMPQTPRAPMSESELPDRFVVASREASNEEEKLNAAAEAATAAAAANDTTDAVSVLSTDSAASLDKVISAADIKGLVVFLSNNMLFSARVSIRKKEVKRLLRRGKGIETLLRYLTAMVDAGDKYASVNLLLSAISKARVDASRQAMAAPESVGNMEALIADADANDAAAAADAKDDADAAAALAAALADDDSEPEYSDASLPPTGPRQHELTSVAENENDGGDDKQPLPSVRSLSSNGQNSSSMNPSRQSSTGILRQVGGGGSSGDDVHDDDPAGGGSGGASPRCSPLSASPRGSKRVSWKTNFLRPLGMAPRESRSTSTEQRIAAVQESDDAPPSAILSSADMNTLLAALAAAPLFSGRVAVFKAALEDIVLKVEFALSSSRTDAVGFLCAHVSSHQAVRHLFESFAALGVSAVDAAGREMNPPTVTEDNNNESV
jgi:hypothetical protein